MKPGETVRFDCDDCLAEFEITYEPKAKGSAKPPAGMKPAEAETCPFCGGDIAAQE